MQSSLKTRDVVLKPAFGVRLPRCATSVDANRVADYARRGEVVWLKDAEMAAYDQLDCIYLLVDKDELDDVLAFARRLFGQDTFRVVIR